MVSQRVLARRIVAACFVAGLASACTNERPPIAANTAGQPTWGHLHTCNAVTLGALAKADEEHERARASGAFDETVGRKGLQAKTFCYERTETDTACLRAEAELLLPVLRAQRLPSPRCARGPFRPSEESPRGERLCCYSLAYAVDA